MPILHEQVKVFYEAFFRDFNRIKIQNVMDKQKKQNRVTKNNLYDHIYTHTN